MYKYRNMKIRKYIPLSNYLYRLPLMMTIEELISFFRLPVYDGNMSGVEGTRYKKQREQLKEEVVSDSNIKFGQLISSDMKKVTIGCAERILSKHVLIVGMPGTCPTSPTPWPPIWRRCPTRASTCWRCITSAAA